MMVVSMVVLNNPEPEQTSKTLLQRLRDFISNKENDNITDSHYLDHKIQQLRSKLQPLSYTYSSKLWLTATEEKLRSNKCVECPYKGLEFFDFNENDPKYFYGI